MWYKGWREQVWSRLDASWDLIVIGGGITGAGILSEAARLGLRALLVEARDFAAGTSSRSSKLVHGGLRYLGNLQLRLVFESIRERERLLVDHPGLIEPLESLVVSRSGDRPPMWVMGAALTLYDLLALKWGHKRHSAAEVSALCAAIHLDHMTGGHSYYDARTDDARLVLRVIRNAVRAGSTALNYARVDGLLRDRGGRVHGVQLRDEVTGRQKEVRARTVISATGAWADGLRAQLGRRPRLRILRGSHLLFPWSRLPLVQSVSFLHPADRRPVFAFPWEGLTIVGTTDLDQAGGVPADPRASAAEIEYLMHAAGYAFGRLRVGVTDVRSTICGIRAVVDTCQANPSKESRDFVLWDEDGLLTVTGGKLTTFRLMARKALRSVRRRLPGAREIKPAAEAATEPGIPSRVLGRYGPEAASLIEAAEPGELTAIADTPALWAELRWAARAEGVVHLEDLLLRRVRLGLGAPQGGLPLLGQIRRIAQPELGWDDAHWQSEADAYARLWRESYSATES